MIPFDLHSHCDLSFDGESTAAEMTERALELGMKYYALTDHIEVNVFYDGEYRCDRTEERAAALLPELKREYSDRLTLLYGVELGQAVHNRELAQRLLRDNKYDFVIGSCHMVRGYDDFYFLDYNEHDPVKLLDIYFEELLETAEWDGFDVMAHLTYPLRYICGDYKKEIDMSRFDAVTDKIFLTLVKNGKGLEINTSGLRQSIACLLPEEKYIRRYYELGGRILTIGSDAHKTSDLGKGIAEGIAAAKSAGFKEIAVYLDREPRFIGI